MPNLREYVTVGICGGYGDGDYKVSSTVADLSVEDMKELRLAFIGAITCAEEMWRNEQGRKHLTAQAKQSDGTDKTPTVASNA